MKEIADALRVDYRRGALNEADCDPDPFRQFQRWFGDAQATEEGEINAMALATCGPGGLPSVRMVLMKDFSPQGVTFYTNYDSRKGAELLHSPNAALLFYWPRLERQVRIEGRVSKTAPELSDRYFAQRPRTAQLAAVASSQSSPLPGRESLEQRVSQLDTQLAGQPVPRPQGWGGYVVAPARFEFWQGRESRLHDRLVYTPAENGWSISRISP
jgi:pyridoxamine 5'-phosphate oxidase